MTKRASSSSPVGPSKRHRVSSSSYSYHSSILPSFPSTPSDSPTNPFGRIRTLSLTLPPKTGFGKHLPLRFQFLDPNSRWKRDKEGINRIVQVPLTYNFTHLKYLIYYLFGGQHKLEDKSDSELGHSFQVVREVEMFNPKYRLGMVRKSQPWIRLSSAKDPYRYKKEWDFMLRSDEESDEEESNDGQDDETEEPVQWEAEEDFTLAHIWQLSKHKVPNDKLAIIYYHTSTPDSPPIQVHITLNKTAVPARKGHSNEPHIFSARGHVYISPQDDAERDLGEEDNDHTIILEEDPTVDLEPSSWNEEGSFQDYLKNAAVPLPQLPFPTSSASSSQLYSQMQSSDWDLGSLSTPGLTLAPSSSPVKDMTETRVPFPSSSSPACSPQRERGSSASRSSLSSYPNPYILSTPHLTPSKRCARSQPNPYCTPSSSKRTSLPFPSSLPNYDSSSPSRSSSVRRLSNLSAFTHLPFSSPSNYLKQTPRPPSHLKKRLKYIRKKIEKSRRKTEKEKERVEMEKLKAKLKTKTGMRKVMEKSQERDREWEEWARHSPCPPLRDGEGTEVVAPDAEVVLDSDPEQEVELGDVDAEGEEVDQLINEGEGELEEDNSLHEQQQPDRQKRDPLRWLRPMAPGHALRGLGFGLGLGSRAAPMWPTNMEVIDVDALPSPDVGVDADADGDMDENPDDEADEEDEEEDGEADEEEDEEDQDQEADQDQEEDQEEEEEVVGTMYRRWQREVSVEV
ncbi:hypothetical protein D9758_007927 [Tetrapyrgos nigripes]|uniref:Uncharacterized protein n=1 Tax=Tetrapyrgos nigripes TaxID=182062 RepID=A0A8H5D660_9AGAR|nr:hypothetical protein D9758_007927 [Tetrapyrgos nigripes]